MAHLQQRLADALRRGAMGLAVQDQRIDRAPDIVDADPAQDAHRAGIGIDLDLADMRARGKGADRHGVVADAVELAAQLLGQIGPRRRRLRHVEDADAAVGALDGERCRAAKSMSTGAASMQMRRDLLALLDDLVRRVADGEAGDPHRAAGMRAAAGAHPVGVVGDEIDAVERHAEPFGQELGEAGLVALAAVHGAQHQLDAALGLRP